MHMASSKDDMRPYLSNKVEQEFNTITDLRLAAYSFESSDVSERFIVEKMRVTPPIIQSWEYKVLVALMFTSIYQHLETEDSAKAIKQFERRFLNRGKAKDQVSGIKIFCDTWRSEAIALCEEFELALNLTCTGDPQEAGGHPLKASLLAELLQEFCEFCAKTQVLKSKAKLDIMKNPTSHGIDLIDAVKQVRSISSPDCFDGNVSLPNSADVLKASSIGYKLKNVTLTKACNEASGRFHAMIAEEDGKEHAGPIKRQLPPPVETVASSSATPATESFDIEKAKKEARSRAVHAMLPTQSQKSVAENSNAALQLDGVVRTALQNKVARKSEVTSQLNPSWGGTSEWGQLQRSDECHAATEDSPNNVDSIYAWASSSTRARYSIWGNIGDGTSTRELNTGKAKIASTSRPAKAAVDDASTATMGSAKPTESRISQVSSSSAPPLQPSQTAIGVENVSAPMPLVMHASIPDSFQRNAHTYVHRKDHRGSGHNRDRGAHVNRPAWQTTSENADLLGQSVAAPTESNVQCRDQSHLAPPPRPDRRGSGLGRGTHVNKPAWMTSRDNGVTIPSHQPNNLQAAFSESGVNPTLGRGRGRAMTTPAWMTNRESNQLS